MPIPAPIKSIHPFPARMAPELALESLQSLKKGSTVLDPMAGSGTVLRHALALGHRAVGFDMDPLAVLMSRVWTSRINADAVRAELGETIQKAKRVDLRTSKLPWQRSSKETRDFAEFWFAPSQRIALTRIAYVLHEKQNTQPQTTSATTTDVLRLALSRIIITKELGASLARDTSHSRPHKVAVTSDYDVFDGFCRSVNQLLTRLEATQPRTTASINLGDARHLALKAGSIDAVVTSPPYLNAIDYMRGHRLALVWLGYSLEELRSIRSQSIGSERAPEQPSEHVEDVKAAMLGRQNLSPRTVAMVERYIGDLMRMTGQIQHVLRKSGRATFVVGNSCLKGSYVNNAAGLAKSAQLNGLKVISQVERELPVSSRYLPVTGTNLSKRMRTETVLTFEK